ncbi:MAG: hypothetical protein EZS28_003072 [Streblomastix strix]|uniref:SPRY domain-containing protein n=1 Tax=Streblomastix strix TaxID=222440 RepID=A0A5J4X403_9EUKA|nr:MAG: hypothetical protein EZS28_003072 [Streblomastix strix]
MLMLKVNIGFDDLNLEKEGGLIRKAITLQKHHFPVPIKRIFQPNSGIFFIQFQFKVNEQDGRLVGVMKNVADIQAINRVKVNNGANIVKINPMRDEANDNMLCYYGTRGLIFYKQCKYEGNDPFKCDDHLIGIELNTRKGELHFFIDLTQQKVFVKGIVEPVKIFGCLYYQSSSFTVVSLKRITAPMSVKIPGERAIEW